VIAEILRSRGNQGEVLAQSTTDVPGRLEGLKRANVRRADGTELTLETEQVWRHGEQWVFKFAGIDSIDEAEKLRGADVWISKSERGELPAGEYFRSDLLGCLVWDEVTGRDLGPVTGFEQYGGPLLLAVAVEGREVLIPFVPEICRTVDVQAKRIGVTLPDGLLEL
jgi:16S rRNA processing protein RimM